MLVAYNRPPRVELSGQEISPSRTNPCAVWSWLDDLREAPRDEWEALLLRQGRPSPFLSPEFLLPWCAAFASGSKQRVGLWRPHGTLSGLIAFYSCSTRPVREPGEPVWELCGGQDLADHLGALIEPGVEDEFWTQFFARLEEPLRLPNLGHDSSLLPWLSRQAERLRFEVTRTDSSPHLLLPAHFEDYLAALDKKSRHEIRRKSRRAQDWVGFRTVSERAELEAWLPSFFRLHRLSQAEKQDFMTPSMVSFFTDMAGRFADRGQLRIGFLLSDEEPIASMFQLDVAGRFHLYNSGYSPGHSHLSPGVVLLTHCIQQAITLGRREYDFLRGTERYKYDLGGRDRDVWRVDFHP